MTDRRHHALGLSADTWRLLVVALAVAIWWTLFFGDSLHANDCIEYVKKVGNFASIPKSLIEDCMRTGTVQAVVTSTIALVTGGTIAVAVNTAIKTAFPTGTEPPSETPGGSDQPKNASTLFANDTCSNCGADLPDPPPANGLCPACGTKNDLTRVGNCPRCGKRINLDGGTCPCGATFPVVDPNEPGSAAGAPQPAASHCRFCGADLPSPPPADGRCAACGAKVPGATSGGGTSGGDPTGDQPGSPPDPSGGTTPATPPATGPTGSAPPSPGPGGVGRPPDPPLTQQSTISGDKAADLLEQSGLAKVTRDADGRVIKVEEAFPNAFTNLGGETVTIKGGETSGGRAGQDFVETAKGKITGIAFEPGPDGSIGKPVIVVNQSEPQWEQRPATPQEVANQMIQDAQDAAAQAQQALHDAVKNVSGQYDDLKQKLGQGDLARDAYRIASFTSSPTEAERTMREYAQKNNLDPDQVMQVAKMDKNMWEGIKAAIRLPDTIRSNLPW